MITAYTLTINDLLKFVGLFIGSTFIAYYSIYTFIKRFQKYHVFADINARSMHKNPAPIGGGWAIIPLALAAWVMFSWPIENNLIWVLICCTSILTYLSWMDDKRHVSQLARLLVQAISIFVILALLPDTKSVISADWPIWMDRLLAGLCWLWFVNLFNFMDGIDGLVGTETLFISTGFIVIGLISHLALPDLYMVTVLAGATAGFLWWNWHPAKIFLGDVGSVPIGFLLGYLLIQLAIAGHIIAAFILPAYFIADATASIVKRIIKKEAFWKPHKTHYYQRAATGLGSHSSAVWRIIAANTGLLILAITSTMHPLISSIFAFALVVSILLLLERNADH